MKMRNNRNVVHSHFIGSIRYLNIAHSKNLISNFHLNQQNSKSSNHIHLPLHNGFCSTCECACIKCSRSDTFCEYECNWVQNIENSSNEFPSMQSDVMLLMENLASIYRIKQDQIFYQSLQSLHPA